MFENVGSKVKLYAKVLFWLGSGLFWWLGLTIFWESMKYDFFRGLLIGALVAGIGTLVIYLSILMMLAFGELVESTTRNMHTTQKIYEMLHKMESKRSMTTGVSPVTPKAYVQAHIQPQAQPQPQNQTTQESGSAEPAKWFCGNCGTQNTGWYTTCSKCGKRKDNGVN